LINPHKANKNRI